MRKLASVRKVDSITPIDKADKIELAHIGGWQCVVGKSDFKSGAYGVFFEIDSFLPIDDSRYEFLHKRCSKRFMNHEELLYEGVRIKTCKLRGVLSQGLLMPIRLFSEISEVIEQQDVTELLRIEHYDELSEKYAKIQGSCSLSSDAKGNFPSYIPKTDEERIENLSEYFASMKDIEFEATFKADGSSLTIFYSPTYRPDDPFGVCSRNLEKKDGNNAFWNIVRKYDIQNKMKEFGKELAIQGELVSPGIQKNRDLFEEPHFLVFRIFDIKNQKWLTPEERYEVCKSLGLEHVHVFKKNWKVFQEITTMEEMKSFVNGMKTERGNNLEGLVFKSMDGFTSFKNINNSYLLEEED